MGRRDRGFDARAHLQQQVEELVARDQNAAILSIAVAKYLGP